MVERRGKVNYSGRAIVGMMGFMLALFGAIACSTIAGEPSALEMEERKAAIQAKAVKIGPFVEFAKELRECDQILSDAARRESILDGAAMTSVISSDGKLGELYDILGKKLELLDELKRDLKQCTGLEGVS